MRNVGVSIYILIFFMLKFVVGDKCEFVKGDGTIASITYQKQQYECVESNGVTKTRSLVPKECGRCKEKNCYGLVCSDACISPDDISSTLCSSEFV